MPHRSEQQEVATSLGLELHEFEDRGHFQDRQFPELRQVLNSKVDQLLASAGTEA